MDTKPKNAAPASGVLVSAFELPGESLAVARLANLWLHDLRVALDGQDYRALLNPIRATGDDRQDLSTIWHA